MEERWKGREKGGLVKTCLINIFHARMPRRMFREVYRSGWGTDYIEFRFEHLGGPITRLTKSPLLNFLLSFHVSSRYLNESYKLFVGSEYSRRVCENFRRSLSRILGFSGKGGKHVWQENFAPELSGIFVQALTPVFSGQARPGSSMLNKYVH